MDDSQQQQQPNDQKAAVVKIEEVFTAMGDAMRSLNREQESIRSTLSQFMQERLQMVELLGHLSEQTRNVVDRQDNAVDAIAGLGKLAEGMDTRIKLLTEFANLHHALFVQHGWAQPVPKGDSGIVH